MYLLAIFVDVILMNKTLKQIQSQPKYFHEHFEQAGCGKVSPERKSIHRVDTKKLILRKTNLFQTPKFYVREGRRKLRNEEVLICIPHHILDL
jgi:hypothetical protein